MSSRRLPVAACSLPLALLLAAAGTVSAGEARGPEEVVRQDTKKVLDILKDPALKAPDKKLERRKKIEDSVGQRFNWPDMAKSSMGAHWKKQTEEQRKEYVDLYTQLVRDTYLTKIDRYSGEEVRYVREEIKGNFAVVSVKIITTKGTDIPVDYRMKKSGDNWLIYDVAVEGVSLVNNYRTQFASMLDSLSDAEFLKELRAKAESLKKE